MMIRWRSLFLCLSFILAAASPALGQQWMAQAGWTRADVGLDDEGDGFHLGVGRVQPLHGGRWELVFAGEYVQKSGSQVMLFSDVETGSHLGPAEITLHYLQPMVSLAYPVGTGPVVWGPYLGGAAALKISESWELPVGEADREYGYQDIDITFNLGVVIRAAGVFVDVRYCAGLTDQLTVLGAPPAKADDPLGGKPLPGAGQKISHWQIGAGYRF